MPAISNKKPIIHLYTICWNEEAMLEFFFRHYDHIVDKYVFYDDGSTDATIEIIRQNKKAEIRTLPRLAVDSYVLSAKEVHQHCWKESRGQADWVILTAVDEFLFHPNLLQYLQDAMKLGVTAIPALGYQMLAEAFPETGQDLAKTITRGAPWVKMNKLSLFRPDELAETNYHIGRHAAAPVGNVMYPAKDELLNLHYKYLSFDFTFARHQQLNEKLGNVDKKNNWGHKYQWDKELLLKDWDYFTNLLVENMTSEEYDAHHNHSEPSARWWRF